jgi:hypothetical protein
VGARFLRLVWAGLRRLCQRSFRCGLTYVGTDSQGTLTATLTTAGVATRQRYKPFGEQRGSAAQLKVLPSERGFIGQVETRRRLSYLNAWHYDTKNAKFISVDPIALLEQTTASKGFSTPEADFESGGDGSIFSSAAVQGIGAKSALAHSGPLALNAYVYGNQNPFLFSDPTGLEPCSWCSSVQTRFYGKGKSELKSALLAVRADCFVGCGSGPSGSAASDDLKYLESKVKIENDPDSKPLKIPGAMAECFTQLACGLATATALVLGGAVTAASCLGGAIGGPAGVVAGCAAGGAVAGAATNTVMQATMKGTIDVCEVGVSAVAGAGTAGVGAVSQGVKSVVAKQVIGKAIGKSTKGCG